MSPNSIPPPALRPPGESERKEKRRKLTKLLLVGLLSLGAVAGLRILCVHPDLGEMVQSTPRPQRQDTSRGSGGFLPDSAPEGSGGPGNAGPGAENVSAQQNTGENSQQIDRTAQDSSTTGNRADSGSAIGAGSSQGTGNLPRSRQEVAASPRSSLHGFSAPSGAPSEGDTQGDLGEEESNSASAGGNEITVTPEELDEGILNNMESLYQNQCAVCHGEKGEGDGPYASMSGPMQSFAERSYWFSFNTEEGAKMILKGTPRGKAGARMPGFYGQLTEDNVYDMIRYLQTLEREEEPENK